MVTPQTFLKYCGNHSLQDVMITSQSRADYLGFVFATSKRKVSPQQVKDWLDQVKVKQKLVGVFVNAPLEDIKIVCRHVELDVIQLHGEETPEDVSQLKHQLQKEVWKVIYHSPQGLDKMREFSSIADGYVVDSKIGNQRGGTGVTFDWSAVPLYQQEAINQKAKCFIAGGINPETVQKLLSYHPIGVDLSSGIETDGQKDEFKKNLLEERLF